jgi:hypothetical protein
MSSTDHALSPLAHAPGGVAASGALRLPGSETTGERAGRWLGSWPFLAGTAVVVVVATVLAVVAHGPPVAALVVVIGGLVLLEMPLLAVAVRSADRTSSGFAVDHLDSDRQLAGEIEELSDTVARLAIELARLNARLRTGAVSARRDAEP